MQLRPPQGLVGVDVADAGDERLVHEQRLEPCPAAADQAAEHAQREPWVERLRADAVERVVVGEVQPDAAELADVAEPDLASVVQGDGEPLVRVDRHGRRHDEHLAGHLEVDREERAAGEVDDDLLAAPPDRLDPPPHDALDERGGIPVAQRARSTRRARRRSPGRDRRHRAAGGDGGRARRSRPRGAQASSETIGQVRRRCRPRRRRVGHHGSHDPRPPRGATPPRPARDQRPVLLARRDGRGHPPAPPRDQGLARADERRARHRRRRPAGRRPPRGRVRRDPHRAVRERPARDRDRADGDGGAHLDRVRVVVGDARRAVPRARHVRRDDGRRDERQQHRRPAGVWSLDPPGLPRPVEHRWHGGRRARRAGGGTPDPGRIVSGVRRARDRHRAARGVPVPPAALDRGCPPRDRRRRRRAGEPAPRRPAAARAGADRDAGDPVHRHPELGGRVERGVPHRGHRARSRDRRRRLRRVHHGDGGGTAHERPLDRPLRGDGAGASRGRDLGGGRRCGDPRRADGDAHPRLPGVRRRGVRHLVDVPGHGDGRRIAAGHPDRPRGRARVVARACRPRPRPDDDRDRRRRGGSRRRVPHPARGCRPYGAATPTSTRARQRPSSCSPAARGRRSTSSRPGSAPGPRAPTS